MGWHGRVKGGYSCANCGTDVTWRDKYCASCEQIPERRCLDCGKATRAGKLDYVYPETATWEQYREVEGFERTWEPKALKQPAHAYRDMVKVVTPGPCCYCESTNLAPLEFGFDQLPETQRECPAWKWSANTKYTNWLNGAKGDPGITLKACASCRQPLAALKASGKMFGERTGNYDMGIREPKVQLPDGRWTYSAEHKVHYTCPDPVFEAVAA